MMKIGALLFAMVFVTSAFGQSMPMIYDTLETRKQEVVLDGAGQLSSTAVSNSLFNFFIKGGEIPENVRSDNYNQHNDLNRVGVIAQGELSYINYTVRPFEKKNWGILVKAGTLTTVSSRYRSGLFGLAFLGNEPFLGTTIDLSNSTATYIGAHKLGFGFIDLKSKSSVNLNVYGITNYNHGYLNNSSLTQDAQGYNAEVILNGQFEKTSRSTYFKGLGVGVDANFILPIDAFSKRSYIQFQVQNLGVAFLIHKVVRYSMDTIIQFNGFEINDFVGDGAIVNNGTSVFDAIGLKNDTITADPIALPFSIQVAKIIDEHSSNLLQSYYGIQAYYQKGAIPMVYAGLQVKPIEWFRFGASVSYGGFAKFRGGLYVQAVMKKINLGIATTNIVGMVSKKGFGQAYSFRINYRI